MGPSIGKKSEVITCKTCGATNKQTWWKCCPVHTTEKGLDVVCQDCANKCLSGKEIFVKPNIKDFLTVRDPMIDPRVVEKLKRGDYQFGHAGRHIGNGEEGCPRTWHHHHDEFCSMPTPNELRAAGIDPNEFTPRSRA